ncbi:MAG TPA: acyl-CoA thioesterase [Quisquiliibacterium sp.]|nr:acyl-CoA thioesterase [Quisquiliibacterium sp.]
MRVSERRLVFQLEIPIRWGDMDAMGHVNNTVYFRYMEQTRIEWFGVMGFLPDPAGQGPIIVNAHCTFERQFEYPGTVLCRMFVGAIGRSSFETFVEMSRTDDPQTRYAHGGAKCVWVDFPKQRSAPLPDSARQAIVTPRV